MAKQETAIFPVLKMINLVAQDQKYRECGVQTDCQIGAHMGHVVTQVDAKSLEDFANTSLSRLESIISQVRVQQASQSEDDLLDGGNSPTKSRGAMRSRSKGSLGAKKKKSAGQGSSKKTVDL